MKVLLTHASKDTPHARRLAQRLRDQGFAVWMADDEITPGDNWAKKLGKALDESELMVVLLSPGALQSDRLRQDIEFAIGSLRYEGRVFSVYLGDHMEAGKDVPWILLKLPHRQVQSDREFAGVATDIQSLFAETGSGRSNA